MKYSLKITVDENDADYKTEISIVSEEQLKRFKPLFEAIKAFVPYKAGENDYTHDSNFPTSEQCRTDLGELTPDEIYPNIYSGIINEFCDLCPSCEYGFHTVVSIEIAPEVKWEKLV